MLLLGHGKKATASNKQQQDTCTRGESSRGRQTMARGKHAELAAFFTFRVLRTSSDETPVTYLRKAGMMYYE